MKASFELHQVQSQFVNSPALLRGFVGGRGSGKSKAGAYDLLTRAKPGRTYMMISPTYRVLQDASLKSFLELGHRFNYISRYWRSDNVIKLGNGAMILCRSADEPDRLRGPNLSGAWFDEAGEIHRDAFDVVIAALREGGERGWLSATFTPRGKTHWTYEVFGCGTGGAQLFRATTRDNPWLPPDFQESIALQYSPMRQRQELGGEFVMMEGAEWPADYFGDFIWFDEWPPHDRGTTVVALDSSKGRGGKSGDYSAFVKVQCTDGNLYVDADMRNDRDASVIADTAVELQTIWKPHVFAIEEEFGGEVLGALIFERANKRKLPPMPLVAVSTGGENKQVRIRRLSPYLNQRRIRFFKRGVKRHFNNKMSDAELLVQQLMEFPATDCHDDGPDALEMAVRVLAEGGVTF